jgi:uncharacterized membrane protein
MRRPARLSIAFLILLIALSTLAATQGETSQITEAQNAQDTAYLAIQNAYNSGAETNQVITQLNQAINLTNQAQQLIETNPQEATTLADQAKAIAENVTKQANLAAETAANAIPVIPIAIAAASVAIGIAVYLLLPKALWKSWLKIRKNYKITINPQKKKDAIFLTAEQLCAIILAVAVLVALVSVSGYILPASTGEQFSELGILGPNMMLGDYPSQVVASDTISLYGYVGNQMGTPMYYTVMVKLGDNQTQTNPANIPINQEFRQVLPNNGTWTFPIDITLTQVGTNQRIIFELWAYNQTTNHNQYQQRWGQIWVNVTAPAR